MLISLTGTPGTGKTSVAIFLQKKGFKLIHLNKLIQEKNLSYREDKKRKSKIVDIKKLDEYTRKKFSGINEDIIFDGHLSHLLTCVDKVIVLRCHPKKLKKRLKEKKWSQTKIRENLEAEILDVILCETTELHQTDDVFEIDTTNSCIEDIGKSIIKIINNNFKPIEKYKIGKIDWSEQILKQF